VNEKKGTMSPLSGAGETDFKEKRRENEFDKPSLTRTTASQRNCCSLVCLKNLGEKQRKTFPAVFGELGSPARNPLLLSRDTIGIKRKREKVILFEN